MKGKVHYESRAEVALLTVENPPVNPLSSGVRQGLYDGLTRALADDAIRALVLTGAGRAFIAGADIAEFGKPAQGPGLHACLALLESSPKPVVAAINGAAFGGGLEVALCCDFRLAVPQAQMGLPEVKLGLLPGAGGTQRLPRLTGVAKALDLILSGQAVPAPKALDLGIVDDVARGDLLTAALSFAQAKAAAGALRKLRDEPVPTLPGDSLEENLAAARRQAARRMRGQFAPEMIVRCIEAAATLHDFDAGLQVEAENFTKCLHHPQRKALIHVFFAERQAAKIPDIPKETPTHQVQRVGVVGCGTMGSGIAICFANAGIPVTVLEMDNGALERGLRMVHDTYQGQVHRKRISKERMEECMGLISGVTTYEQLADMNMVIEAVYENLDVKIEVFKQLDACVKSGGLLMSNTSGLNVDRIAAATSRPELVAGMHFFSPANVMRLLEVVRGKASAPSTVATAMRLGPVLGKVSVLAGNCPGFIGNRMLAGYSKQAGEIILQGATPYQVDKVMGDFGMPMGPFQMADLVGLDLGWRARKLAGGREEDRPLTAIVPDKLCELGCFGQKTGKGFYVYAEGSRAGAPNPEVANIIAQTAMEHGFQLRTFSAEEILKRCLYPLINEGAKILEEGIALRPGDIDIVYINGYGFPPYVGGPMFYADQVGLPTILQDLQALQEELGDFWKPAPLIQRLVAEGRGFQEL